MSGSSIPYHLRPNKAVDRNLFIETLRMLDRVGDIDMTGYRYIGFAGPYLEDFKALHSALGISDMVSLEREDKPFRRQKFNRPLGCIEPLHTTSTSYISEYEWDKSSLFWLDFTAPGEIYNQIHDYKCVLEEAIPNTIVKITVNCHFPALGQPQSIPDECETEERKKKYRKQYKADILSDRMREYSPDPINIDDMTKDRLPRVYMQALSLATEAAECAFIPLTAFYYADGQAMLTMCGIVIEKGEEDRILHESGMQDWEFSLNGNWDAAPSLIAVPDLTIKERTVLDRYLLQPRKRRDKEFEEVCEFVSETQIENYKIYNRFCPLFARIHI